MINNLAEFVFKKQVEVSEFLLGLFAIFWGVWAVYPDWGIQIIRATELSTLTPEWFIGTVFVSLGIVLVIFSATKYYVIRKFVALAHILAWMFVAVNFTVAGLSHHPVSLYMILGVVSFWTYIRLVFIESAYKNSKY
jgi:hypothetical protein